MANRHKTQALKSGGKVEEEVSSKVETEAKERKAGGRIPKRKEGGKVPGRKSGGRLDKFARGGGVGADKHPFSSAHIKG